MASLDFTYGMQLPISTYVLILSMVIIIISYQSHVVKPEKRPNMRPHFLLQTGSTSAIIYLLAQQRACH